MMVRCSHKKCEHKVCPHYEPHEEDYNLPDGVTITGPGYCTGSKGYVKCIPVNQ